MNLDYIQNNAVTVNGFVYRPAVVPVDYCGTIVYNAALHLIVGTPVNHSSLELAETDGEDARFAGTVALMQRSVDAAGLRPRCDYLDAALTKAYRELCGLPQPIGRGERLPRRRMLPLRRRSKPCGRRSKACRSRRSGPHLPRSAGRASHAAHPLRAARRGGPFPRRRRPDQGFRARRETCPENRTDFRCPPAILKEKSPSCGSHLVYDGTFSGKVIPGEGLTAALLREAGVEIQTEEDFQ